MAGMPAFPGFSLFSRRWDGIPPVDGRRPTENQIGCSRIFVQVA